jgi:hypothetical protein
MKRSERQLHLRLNTGHADHATASGALHQELKECRLANTRFALQHERPAFAAPHGSKELFKLGAFRCPANKSHGTSSAHGQRRLHVLLILQWRQLLVGALPRGSSADVPQVGHGPDGLLFDARGPLLPGLVRPVAVVQDRLHHQEVAGDDRVRPGGQELPPGRPGPARCRLDARSDPSSWGKEEDSISAARFSASYSGRAIIFPLIVINWRAAARQAVAP